MSIDGFSTAYHQWQHQIVTTYPAKLIVISSSLDWKCLAHSWVLVAVLLWNRSIYSNNCVTAEKVGTAQRGRKLVRAMSTMLSMTTLRARCYWSSWLTIAALHWQLKFHGSWTTVLGYTLEVPCLLLWQFSSSKTHGSKVVGMTPAGKDLKNCLPLTTFSLWILEVYGLHQLNSWTLYGRCAPEHKHPKKPSSAQRDWTHNMVTRCGRCIAHHLRSAREQEGNPVYATHVQRQSHLDSW